LTFILRTFPNRKRGSRQWIHFCCNNLTKITNNGYRIDIIRTNRNSRNSSSFQSFSLINTKSSKSYRKRYRSSRYRYSSNIHPVIFLTLIAGINSSRKRNNSNINPRIFLLLMTVMNSSRKRNNSNINPRIFLFLMTVRNSSRKRNNSNINPRIFLLLMTVRDSSRKKNSCNLIPGCVLALMTRCNSNSLSISNKIRRWSNIILWINTRRKIRGTACLKICHCKKPLPWVPLRVSPKRR